MLTFIVAEAVNPLNKIQGALVDVTGFPQLPPTDIDGKTTIYLIASAYTYGVSAVGYITSNPAPLNVTIPPPSQTETVLLTSL